MLTIMELETLILEIDYKLVRLTIVDTIRLHELMGLKALLYKELARAYKVELGRVA